MLQKEKKLQKELKEKVKTKASEIGSQFSRPLPAQINKTFTKVPSYIHPQKQLYLDMKENLHLIINKASFMSLKKQAKTPTFKPSQQEQKAKQNKLNPKEMLNTVVGKQYYTNEVHNTRVMGCMPNEHCLGQLWALVADEIHDDTFYIYNVESNMVLKVENDKVVLAPKEKTKQFMFYIPKDTDKGKSFSIYRDAVNIVSSLNGKSLALKGVLVLTQTNTKDESQLFHFKKINLYEPLPFRNTYILFNPQDKDKDKAFLSVSKDKEQLCYHKIDYSLYQRWIFSPMIEALNRNINYKNQVDMVKQSHFSQQKQKQNKSNIKQERPSQLDKLNEAQINLITTAAKNLIQAYDNDCCEIINFKLQKSLVLRQEKGIEKLVFVPKSQKREWKMQCDGFSIKIKHDRTGQYLGVKDQQIVLAKDPQYWQVFQSSKNAVQANSRMGHLRGSFDEKYERSSSPKNN